MRLKDLESFLQGVKPFAAPKPKLEQYPTSAHIAATLLFTIDNSYNELKNSLVLDLGCGTGMLSIGAALLGASSVLGVDIDGDALEIAQSNLEEYDDDLPIDFLQCEVSAFMKQQRLCADVVVMNPPFGTKGAKGADVDFLRAAFSVSRGSIYSLHKTSTRSYIRSVAERELHAASAEVVARLRYDLPATMKFHRQKSVDIEVDVWRFTVPPV